jgi:hypothetical protein
MNFGFGGQQPSISFIHGNLETNSSGGFSKVPSQQALLLAG